MGCEDVFLGAWVFPWVCGVVVTSVMGRGASSHYLGSLLWLLPPSYLLPTSLPWLPFCVPWCGGVAESPLSCFFALSQADNCLTGFPVLDLPAAPGLAWHAPCTWQEELVPVQCLHTQPCFSSSTAGPKQMGQKSNVRPTIPVLP